MEVYAVRFIMSGSYDVKNTVGIFSTKEKGENYINQQHDSRYYDIVKMKIDDLVEYYGTDYFGEILKKGNKVIVEKPNLSEGSFYVKDQIQIINSDNSFVLKDNSVVSNDFLIFKNQEG